MLVLYNALLLGLRPLVWLRALAGRRGASRREWDERSGLGLPRVRQRGVWLHGASVGEARILRSLADALRRRRSELPIYATALTRTGREQLSGLAAADLVAYAPLDMPRYARRALDTLSPTVLVMIETELWPNILREASARGVRLGLVNGRLAPERMGRYRRLRGLYGRLLLSFDRIGAQSKDDAERFIELGARREVVVVTGNVKFDLPEPTTDAPGLRRRFGIDADRPIVAAGSTGPGEEEIVLRSYSTLRARLPRTFLVLAPRHVERVREVLGVASSMNIGLHRLSSRSDAEAGSADGLLVDTLGELPSLYPLADATFVGGSLVPVGGHNLLEPAAAGVPVVFGPHVHHVAEMADSLLRAGAAVQVTDGAALESAWYRILTDRTVRTDMIAAARETVRANRGALDRTADLVDGLFLDAVRSAP